MKENDAKIMEEGFTNHISEIGVSDKKLRK
jgi:hypothetical protein